jgi:hypothetical protein
VEFGHPNSTVRLAGAIDVISSRVMENLTINKRNMTSHHQLTVPKNNSHQRAPWRREKMKRPFSLISTAFLSSRRQSSIAGRFSFFIGGASYNVARFGRQEGLPLDAKSTGGLVGRSLGQNSPRNQTNGSPYLLARSASSFQQRP